MKLIFQFIIIIIFFNIPGKSQSYFLELSIEPSFWNNINLIIYEKDNEKKINISIEGTELSITSNLRREHHAKLFNFFQNYSFKKHTSSKYTKKYFDNKIIPDDTILNYKLDTVYLFKGISYYYDKKNNKYYKISHNFTTDGTNYYGQYITTNGQKDIRYFSPHKDTKEYELNLILYDIMLQYCRKTELEDYIRILKRHML